MLSFDEKIAQSVDVITEACRQLTPDGSGFGHDGIILRRDQLLRFAHKRRYGIAARVAISCRPHV
jgi:hypothetical protein